MPKKLNSLPTKYPLNQVDIALAAECAAATYEIMGSSSRTDHDKTVELFAAQVGGLVSALLEIDEGRYEDVLVEPVVAPTLPIVDWGDLPEAERSITTLVNKNLGRVEGNLFDPATPSWSELRLARLGWTRSPAVAIAVVGSTLSESSHSSTESSKNSQRTIDVVNANPAQVLALFVGRAVQGNKSWDIAPHEVYEFPDPLGRQNHGGLFLAKENSGRIHPVGERSQIIKTRPPNGRRTIQVLSLGVSG